MNVSITPAREGMVDFVLLENLLLISVLDELSLLEHSGIRPHQLLTLKSDHNVPFNNGRISRAKNTGGKDGN